MATFEGFNPSWVIVDETATWKTADSPQPVYVDTWPEDFVAKASASAIAAANKAHPQKNLAGVLGIAPVSTFPPHSFEPIGYVTDDGMTDIVQTAGKAVSDALDAKVMKSISEAAISITADSTQFQEGMLKLLYGGDMVNVAVSLPTTYAAMFPGDPDALNAMSFANIQVPKQLHDMIVTREFAHPDPRLESEIVGPYTLLYDPQGPSAPMPLLLGGKRMGFISHIATEEGEYSEVSSWQGNTLVVPTAPPKATVTWQPGYSGSKNFSTALAAGGFTSFSQAWDTLGVYEQAADRWVRKVGESSIITTGAAVRELYGIHHFATGGIHHFATGGIHHFATGGVISDGSHNEWGELVHNGYVTPAPAGVQDHSAKAAKLQKVIPGLKKSEVTCPHRNGMYGKRCREKGNVWSIIIHLNDEHHWPRETKIADWLDTLEGIDLTVHLPENEGTE